MRRAQLIQLKTFASFLLASGIAGAAPTPAKPATKAIASAASAKAAASKASNPKKGDNGGYGDNVPHNQPFARFAGHAPVADRPADPRPHWLGGPLRKLGVILGPDKKVPWRARSAFNPSAIVKDGEVHLLVRVQDEEGAGKWFGTSRIALARSKSGTRDFTWHPVPVLEPTEWYESKGGVEDARVVEIKDPPPGVDRYVMPYTGFRWEDRTARLAIATSNDLIHWRKQGLAFPNAKKEWTKAGVIIPQKVNGEWLMYHLYSPPGGHEEMYLARSKDMKTWVRDDKPIITRREGYWDALLTEPGAFRHIDSDGNIHITYNGDAPPHGYAAGDLVLSGKDPRKVLSRSNTPWLDVTEKFEEQGQVGKVIFQQGMVSHQGQELIYYGAADGRVAVAVAKSAKGER